MKKVGIALIVIEAIAVVAGLAMHKSPIIDLFTSNEAGLALIFKVIGYLIPGIIGVILLVKANKQENAASAGAGASAAGKGVCSKCGAKTEPGDVFCASCGAKLN